MTRTGWVGLLALLGVELALVLGVFVASPHPGGDNAGYVALADALVSGEGYTEVWDPERPPHTKYPPVFPALLGLALLLGVRGWVGLKGVSVAAALAVVAFTWLWARRRVGETSAFGVALLVGLSPALLYHAHWVLSDVPFLAFLVAGLWLLDPVRSGEGGGDAAAPAEAVPATDPGGWSGLSLREWLGLGAVVLAALTRTAGMPLAAAAVGALLLARRFRAALVAGLATAIPLGAWILRGRMAGPGEGRYGSEFFLLDPYRPDLGTAGPGDFVARFGENLGGYLGRWLPEALTGGPGGWPTAVVGAVVLLAVVGWTRRLRPVAAAELFLPLYTGIILLWPAVWSGDRFALPLVPLLLVYAVDGLTHLLARAGRPGWQAGARTGLALLLALPAAADWTRAREEAAACRGAVEAAGMWACGGGALVDFTTAARWAGEELTGAGPAGAGPAGVGESEGAGPAALTRKPRIWYLMSGIPTRTYPFTEAPGVLLAEAEAAGAGLVVLDFVGGQGVQFVGSAVAASPERFCQRAAVGGDRSVPATRILRILPPSRPSGSRRTEAGLSLAPCPADGGEAGGEAVIPRESGAGSGDIPILRGGR